MVNRITVGWSGRWSDIDEATRDDSDWMFCQLLPQEGVTASLYQCGLSDVTDPTTGLGHVMRYVYRKDSTVGRTITLRVRLLQGTTAKATRTHSDIGSVWVQADETLTVAEADAISDYTDLRMEFRFTVSGTGLARSGGISWAELEVPTP